jgi:cytidyltransferase-like protein
MNNIVVITGGFDPLHSGHISYINEASKLGTVVVGLNSDSWLTRKKGRPFMNFHERFSVLSNLKPVSTVIEFDDSDNTACNAIEKAKLLYPNNQIIFANGGDRTSTNIPEMDKFESDPQVTFLFGVGGDDKKNSSSWILNDWKHPSENRVWGKFITYYDSSLTKVKRLLLEPGKSISMQYHNHRSEFWFVESGEGIVTTLDESNNEVIVKNLKKHDNYFVPNDSWHKLKCTSNEILSIIEIQYGSVCDESDIIRFQQ